MEFKEFLRKQRVERGLNIKELAAKTGISQSYLSQLETGVRQPPTAAKLKLIAVALNVPLSVFKNLADQDLYSEEYLQANLDYNLLYKKLNEIVDSVTQAFNSESELVAKYNLAHLQQSLSDLLIKVNSLETQLGKIAAVHQVKKYPLPVENLIEDLLLIGGQGQEYVRMQIAIFKEMFLDKSATV